MCLYSRVCNTLARTHACLSKFSSACFTCVRSECNQRLRLAAAAVQQEVLTMAAQLCGKPSLHAANLELVSVCDYVSALASKWHSICIYHDINVTTFSSTLTVRPCVDTFIHNRRAQTHSALEVCSGHVQQSHKKDIHCMP